MKVDNKSIIRKLTLRFMKAGRTRNIIAVIAIALTSIMFTSVFTIGANMLTTIQEQTMRQIGMSAHGGFKRLSSEQYEHIAKSPLIKDISFRKGLALAENDALIKEYSEITYAEPKFAKWCFSFPTTGNMPVAKNELATSTLVLDALGLPHEIGVQVPLEFTVSDRKYTETFTLSAYWEGDTVLPAQHIWLSEEYVDSVVAENVIAPTEQIAGHIFADLWFGNSFNIESKMEKLIAERGYVWGDGYDEETGYGTGNEVRPGINWAYMTSEIDPSTVTIGALAVILILLSGYFIIYSIFVISVNADIHFYGLLKTMGATGKQLKKIVRGQAFALSIIGIPLGLILGYISGIVMTPLLLGMSTLDVKQTISVNPLIFIFAALFSLLTVFIGCNKPGKIAAKVSPVEAVKYSGNLKIKKKTKKSRKVSTLSMAWASITREKRKLCVIVMSLSLALIMLNSAYSASLSFDMDKYLESYVTTDFAVSDATIFNYGIIEKNTDSVTSEFLDELDSRGITDYGCVYYHAESLHELSPRAHENFIKMFEAGRQDLERYYKFAIPQYERAVLEKTIPLQIYGHGKLPAETFYDDYEKLASGDYVLVFGYSGENMVYAAGDKIIITNNEGESREFEVIKEILGEGYPDALSVGFGLMPGEKIVMAENIFIEFFGEQSAMQVNFNVEDERIQEIETWLIEYTQNINPELAYASRATYTEEFESMQSTYIIMGGAMAFILALIGILNFTNSTIASIISRRRELAMLQSVGMTGKQLRQTLFFEGFCYTVLTVIFTFTAGLGITWLIVKVIAGQAWFFKQSFTIMPSVFCLAPLVAICAAAPIVCYGWLTRNSLVERLRVE
ncbi:MAG: ABC transporter permease [Oscillospiraceae bacterium]|nr:ABC transporter permease [Oscillospiraceae bacterium]